MMKLLFYLFMILWPHVVWADYIGCYNPGETIPLPSSYFNASGASTAATLKVGYLITPTNTLYRTVTNDQFTQINAANQPGEYLVSFTVPQVVGLWRWSVEGTVEGTASDSTTDYFRVAVPGTRC